MYLYTRKHNWYNVAIRLFTDNRQKRVLVFFLQFQTCIYLLEAHFYPKLNYDITLKFPFVLSDRSESMFLVWVKVCPTGLGYSLEPIGLKAYKIAGAILGKASGSPEEFFLA